TQTSTLASPGNPDVSKPTLTQPPQKSANGSSATDASSSSKSDAIGDNPNKDYKSSLNALSTLYQDEVQRLEKQNNQAKELYKEGLISRMEMERSDKTLADARAKVEEVARQIAVANQPLPTANVSSNLEVSNRAWTTGNNRIDGLIRYYGNQY